METPRKPLDPRVVVRVVHAVCDRYTYYTMDDLASDLIVSIWTKQTEFENEVHLRRYVWRALENHMMNRAKALRRIRMFSECLGEDQSEEDWLDTVGAYPAPQDGTIDAKRLKKMAREWPLVHRKVFGVLAEGGSILEAANEFGLSPWDAIRLLREMRQFAETGCSIVEWRTAA